jgi:TolB-like protein
MPSILPNYEYDIFISYRQNDNKRDGWVTKFVNTLRDELEATLKNPVSIYFDENPHDGLLETHQVDASLDSKLRCLVFIPIISQTYCHPEGYAWGKEFLPFIEMANADELGMNIRLANGNVTGRVLPIKIHDLDTEDQLLLEEKLGGPLRAIDFIYQEPGVNRPLTPEDAKADNLNGTSYKNQVNKVANALKDLGAAMVRASRNEGEQAQPLTSRPQQQKSNKKPWLIGLGAIAILILAYFGYSFFNSASTANLEKSIAVLPFTKVNSGDEIDALAFGLHDDLLTQLSKFNELQVTSRTSVMEYAESKKKIADIADELGVSYILEGSIQQANNRFRLNIQLISGEEDDHLWAEIFDMELTTDNIFQIQSEIASSIAKQLRMNMTPANQNNVAPTESLQALQLYNQGIMLYQFQPYKSIDRLEEALVLDPDFHKARAGLIRVLALTYKGGPDSIQLKTQAEAEITFLKRNSNDSHLLLMAQTYYDYYVLGDFEKAQNELKKGDQSNPDVQEAQGYLARRLGDWDTYFEFQEDHNLKRDPRNPQILQDLAFSYALVNNGTKSLELIDRAIDYSADPTLKDLKFNLLLSNLGRISDAQRFYVSSKPVLTSNQLGVWTYWLNYFNRNYKAIINPEYEVPKNLVISNGDYSLLINLPTNLFIAQAYFLSGDKISAAEVAGIMGKQYLDIDEPESCKIQAGEDFYSNHALEHIAKGYTLVFLGNNNAAIEEAKHGISLYPYEHDAVQGQNVADYALRVIALTGNKEETLAMIKYIMSIPSWTSAETLKNDPIYDPYRDLDEFKSIIAQYSKQ